MRAQIWLRSLLTIRRVDFAVSATYLLSSCAAASEATHVYEELRRCSGTSNQPRRAVYQFSPLRNDTPGSC